MQTKDDAVKILVRNIRETIKSAKRSGTVGMSRQCLKQNTATRGLVCSVGIYEQAFNEACDAIKVSGFRIYA